MAHEKRPAVVGGDPSRAAGRLAGKRAIVTGAGSGIGRASSRLFAAEGAQFVIKNPNATTTCGCGSSFSV